MTNEQTQILFSTLRAMIHTSRELAKRIDDAEARADALALSMQQIEQYCQEQEYTAAGLVRM